MKRIYSSLWLLLIGFFCLVLAVACGDDGGDDGGQDGNDAANQDAITENQNGDGEPNQQPGNNEESASSGDDDENDINDEITDNDESEPNGGANNGGDSNDDLDPNQGVANNGDDSNNGETDPDTDGPMFCRQSCEVASDCGEESQWMCEDNLCEWEQQEQAATCDDDAECVALYSGWADPCQHQDECAVTQACIEHEGEGLCAFAEGEHIDCDTLQMERITIDLYGESGQTVACGKPHAICDPDLLYCVEGCQSDTDCIHPGADTCVDGRCMCGSDAACEELPNSDTCYDGACGCSSDAVCTEEPFDVCA